MKNIEKKYLSPVGKQNGFTLLEMMVVVSIILILMGMASAVLTNFKSKSLVRAGIQRVEQLKKGMETLAKLCQGYPERSASDDINQLKKIIDWTTAGGRPRIYPSAPPPDPGRECDAGRLQETIASGLKLNTCASNDPACQKEISGGMHNDFSSMFVEDNTGIGVNCSVSGGGIKTGWNYTLCTDISKPYQRPVPVYCANVIYADKSVTVVINGSGIYNNTQVNDGTGTIGPTCSNLPGTACPCGPWCSDNKNNISGCCDTCVSNGVTIPGIGFKY